MALSAGNKNIKTAVFISGTGSNLKNLIKFSLLKKSPIKIKFVISNKKKIKGLDISKRYTHDTIRPISYYRAEKSVDLGFVGSCMVHKGD